jgi:hypothetical protein
MSRSSQRFGNERLLIFRKQDLYELQSRASSVIHFQCDQRAFPIHAFTFARLFLATEPAIVGFRADHQNEAGFIKPVEHPSRPSFFGRAVQVLI